VAPVGVGVTRGAGSPAAAVDVDRPISARAARPDVQGARDAVIAGTRGVLRCGVGGAAHTDTIPRHRNAVYHALPYRDGLRQPAPDHRRPRSRPLSQPHIDLGRHVGMHLALAQLPPCPRVGWIRLLPAGHHGALLEVTAAQIADHGGCGADGGGGLPHAGYGTRDVGLLLPREARA
jgi:hypothetical protein